VKLRDLPSVDELLRDERLSAEPHDLVVVAARTVLERARADIVAGRRSGVGWPVSNPSSRCTSSITASSAAPSMSCMT